MDNSLLKEINHKYDVIVIGGGCAGVEATNKLYTSGIKNILLLEAQERLGGRIHTTYLNDDKTTPIELGANWIHGIVGNPLYKLVRENTDWFCQEKLELFSDDAIYCADETGKRYSSALCYEIYDLYRKFNNDAKSYYNANKVCPYEDYADFIRKKFEPLMRNDNEELKRFKEAMIRRLLKQETVEHSSDTMEEITIEDYGSYLKLTGPDFEFPGGFSTLIQFLASKIPKELIKLNHAVERISLNSNYKTAGHKPFDGLIVKCSNGNSFQTDHVIITSSLNFLKKNYTTLFERGLLSKTKFEALNNMKMGNVNKIFLVYDDLDFFPKDFNTIHPLFFNDHNFNSKSEWYLKVFSFDKFYDNVILVWATGDVATHVENLSEQEIAEVLTKLLKKFLKNDNIPLPRKMIRTKWNSDPYACGAYSYVPVNCNPKTTFQDLIEPIYIDGAPRIMFAGEATHPRFYSTVHGAYLSGQREAKRLVDYFSIKTKRTQ